MTTTFHPLALLPVLPYNTLTERQARGLAWAWDGEDLTTIGPLDLGERSIRRIDSRTSWFPRACRRCAEREALKAVVEHGQSCEQCVDDHTRCPTGLRLVRTVRAARR
ncbi:hypothetical protein FRZ03_04205 [Streptomyces misionensis]|uniref:Uncharacterized protein n=1 Tax=Streptomyces misionensis TaxID=67331 RepID=A0A5C6K1N8_9ACTN|nr:hypothetical protein [Streptomyces misionensis]TWV56313.1 hypothetical protein FRZ03_04205 [Streptomyces misionensis]